MRRLMCSGCRWAACSGSVRMAGVVCSVVRLAAAMSRRRAVGSRVRGSGSRAWLVGEVYRSAWLFIPLGALTTLVGDSPRTSVRDCRESGSPVVPDGVLCCSRCDGCRVVSAQDEVARNACVAGGMGGWQLRGSWASARGVAVSGCGGRVC